MAFPRPVLIALVASSFAAATAASAALSPEAKCQLDKQKAAALYYKCLNDAAAKAVKKGTVEDVAKCNETLTKKWQKATERAVKKGATCLDAASSEATIQGRIADEEDAVATILAGCPGLPLFGACWVLGRSYDRFTNTPAQSCDDACAAVGLAYSSETDTAINGASLPLDVCFELVSRLVSWGGGIEIPIGTFGDDGTCSDLGCHIVGGSGFAVRRCSGGPATSSAVSSSASRVCACE